VRTKKSNNTLIPVLFLICLITASNTSGGLVLCIADNGHVAFEAAIHRHCNDLSHTEHKGVNISTREAEIFDETHHCKPCIDIPITMNSAKDSLLPNQAKQNKLSIRCLAAKAPTTDSTFVSIRTANNSHTLTCQFIFLNTIILLV
jgi:hypothetical protein